MPCLSLEDCRGAYAWFSPALCPSSTDYQNRWSQLGGIVATPKHMRAGLMIDYWFADSARPCFLIEKLLKVDCTITEISSIPPVEPSPPVLAEPTPTRLLETRSTLPNTATRHCTPLGVRASSRELATAPKLEDVSNFSLVLPADPSKKRKLIDRFSNGHDDDDIICMEPPTPELLATFRRHAHAKSEPSSPLMSLTTSSDEPVIVKTEDSPLMGRPAKRHRESRQVVGIRSDE